MLKDEATEKRLITHAEERVGKKEKKGTSAERKAAQAAWAKKKRAEKKAAAGKPAKPAKAPKGAKRLGRAIAELASAGTVDAADAAKRITKRYDALQSAIAKAKKVADECKVRLGDKDAEFTAVIEAPIDPGEPQQAVKKLSRVVVTWQELGEVKAQNSVEKSLAKDARQKALSLFEKSIEEYKQLSLPGMAAD